MSCHFWVPWYCFVKTYSGHFLQNLIPLIFAKEHHATFTSKAVKNVLGTVWSQVPLRDRALHAPNCLLEPCTGLPKSLEKVGFSNSSWKQWKAAAREYTRHQSALHFCEAVLCSLKDSGWVSYSCGCFSPMISSSCFGTPSLFTPGTRDSWNANILANQTKTI